jgi:lantibiotic modifying enzyme
LRIPGLFHGSAGIGYAMLRLAAPDRLPALVAFELPGEGVA